MSWNAQIFRYCERGADPSFWGEPLNAVSNGAFLLAAIAAAVIFMRRRGEKTGALHAVAVSLLIALVFVIGVGSFLFHTYATRWAALADTLPIGIFMLAYLGYALRAYVGLHWIWVLAGLALFIGALQYAGGIQCRPGLISATAAARGPCLNGTVGYVPAFLAMIGIGVVLKVKGHWAAKYLIAAGMVFLASMIFRTIDFEVCGVARLAGRTIGTHALWHVLNAITLYLLLLAAIRNSRARAS